MPGGMPSVPPELATALILSSLDSRSISRLVCLRKKSKSLYKSLSPGTYLAQVGVVYEGCDPQTGPLLDHRMAGQVVWVD